MYAGVTTDYLNSIYSDDRTIRISVTDTSDAVLFTEDELISMEYESSIEGPNGMYLSGTVSNKVSLKVYKSAFDRQKDDLKGKLIKIGVSVNSFIVPMGRYYIDSVDVDDGGFVATLEMYDGMAYKTDILKTDTDLTSAPQVLSTISGMTTKSTNFSTSVRNTFVNTFPIRTYKALAGEITARDLIGFLGGLEGTNMCISRTGSSVDFVSQSVVTSSRGVPADAIYQDGFKQYVRNEPMNGLLVNVSNDEQIHAGSTTGNVIAFYNPLMVNSVLQTIYQNQWRLRVLDSYNIHYRGNPAYDVGDRITVNDKNGTAHQVTITRHVIRVNGGMDGEIYCTYPSSEGQESGSYSPIASEMNKRMPVISREYQPESIDGMSGIAVAEAINGIYVGGRNYLLESYARATGTSSGITRTYLGDCTYRINGTATAEYDGAVYTLSTVNFEPGRYTISFVGDVSKLKDVYVSVGTPSATETAVFNSTDKQRVTFDIPEGKVIRYVGVHVDSGVTIDTEIQLKMEKGSIQTDWTPAPRDLLTVTTESITGISIPGGTENTAFTLNITKEGYYPLGIVGDYWSSGTNTMYALIFHKYLSAQNDGSGTITCRLRNMLSSSYTLTGTLNFKVLWIKI